MVTIELYPKRQVIAFIHIWGVADARDCYIVANGKDIFIREFNYLEFHSGLICICEIQSVVGSWLVILWPQLLPVNRVENNARYNRALHGEHERMRCTKSAEKLSLRSQFYSISLCIHIARIISFRQFQLSQEPRSKSLSPSICLFPSRVILKSCFNCHSFVGCHTRKV